MNAQKAVELLLKLAEDETLYNATGLDSPGHRHFEATKTALLARIEAGDKARAIVAEIAEVNKYEHDNDDLAIAVAGIINKHSDWLDELPT